MAVDPSWVPRRESRTLAPSDSIPGGASSTNTMRGVVVVRRSFWRFAVVLALVPVVLIATPTLANAATANHTDYVPASFDFGGWGPDSLGVPLDSAVCSGSFAMSIDALGQVMLKTGGGGCVGSVDHSPFSCQTFEQGCTNYRLTFRGAGTCDAVVMLPTAGNHPRDGVTSVASTWGAATSLAGTCDPTQVCLNASTSGWGNDAAEGICSDLELDPPTPDPVSPACAYGAARKPTIGPYGWPGGSEYNTKGRKITALLTDNPSGTWRVIAVTKGGAAYGPTINVTGETLGVEVLAENLDTINSADPATWEKWARFAEWYGSAAGKSGELAGVQFWREGVGPTPNFGTVTGKNLGTTDPSLCMYYYGQKIADAAGTETDEPSAAITLPEDPAEVGPTPPPLVEPEGDDPVDETTTENTWWGMVIALLRAVVGGIVNLGKAIAGLAGDIVAGIMGGMTALFVPDSAAIDAEVSGLRDSWDGTSLAKWKTAVTGNSYSMPGAGCNGVPVDVTLPGGIAIHERLGEACSGTMANTAQIIKVVMSAGLVIFGGIACLRALGSGFGWNPGIGRGAES